MAQQLGPLGDVGPCQIDWNSVAIASCMEGASFRFTMGFAEVREAEHGLLAVDAVFTGMEQVEFEVPLTRITYTNLASLIPGSSRSGESGSGGIEVYSNRVGTTMYSSAKELIVKRIVNGVVDTDQARWLHLRKTYPIPRFDVPYNLEGQRGFMVLFKAFPDASNSDLVWHIGDKFS